MDEESLSMCSSSDFSTLDAASSTGRASNHDPAPRGQVCVQISVPELSTRECMQFDSDELVLNVKQQFLKSLPKELKESFNYGLFVPATSTKAGKFMDEMRPLSSYPFTDNIGFLELRYKRRVYKMLQLNEKSYLALHNKSSLRRFIDCVNNLNADKVTKLCSKGLDPNFHCSQTGETPLTLSASLKGSSSVVIALVNGGAMLDYRNKRGVSAVHTAVVHDNHATLQTLMELGSSPNYQDSDGLTPLYYSVINSCQPTIILALLHEHAALDCRDAQGWTEAHQAARHSLTQHLEHLIHYGADMNARNASGNTPLHVCAAYNEQACARVLLHRGADTLALNYAHQSAYQVAVIAGNLQLADVISSHQPQQVVAFKGTPDYNPRRRLSYPPANDMMMTDNAGVGSSMSPTPSDRSWAPLSSTSSTSGECSSFPAQSSVSGGGSGGSAAAHAVTVTVMDRNTVLRASDAMTDHLDAVSESSGVGTSQGSGSSNDGCCPAPACPYLAVCTQPHRAAGPRHLSLEVGDCVEVLASGDCGLLEGRVDRGDNSAATGRLGLFPEHCIKPTQSQNHWSSRAASCTPAAPVSNGGGGAAAGLLPRTVKLRRGRRGFGFVLRGAKGNSPLMRLDTSLQCPSLQYLDLVDEGGVADQAGLCTWDFLLKVNGTDVCRQAHEAVVDMIRRSGDTVTLTVVSPVTVATTDEKNSSAGGHHRATQSLTRQMSAVSLREGGGMVRPAPPTRDPRTTLSVGRAAASAMLADMRPPDDSVIYGVGEKVASVRCRPAPQRPSPRQLQDMFARQGSAPQYPPSAGQGGPRVYASVAEMKRLKGKKTSAHATIEQPSSALRNDASMFHSTPDLLRQVASNHAAAGGGPSCYNKQQEQHYAASTNGSLKQRSSSQGNLKRQPGSMTSFHVADSDVTAYSTSSVRQGPSCQDIYQPTYASATATLGRQHDRPARYSQDNYHPQAVQDSHCSQNSYQSTTGPTHSQSMPNFGQQATPKFPQATPNYPQATPNYPPATPNYQQATPNYPQATPNYQQTTPNYHQATPNYPPATSNYQQATSNYPQFTDNLPPPPPSVLERTPSPQQPAYNTQPQSAVASNRYVTRIELQSEVGGATYGQDDQLILAPPPPEFCDFAAPRQTGHSFGAR